MRCLVWFRARSEKEKNTLKAGSAFLVFVFVYLVLLEPAWIGRKKLVQEIPQLRTTLAQIEALAAESKTLTVKKPVPADQVKAFLDRSIDRAGLRSALTHYTLGENTLQLRFEGASFPEWLAWLSSVTKATHLSVQEVTLLTKPARAALKVPEGGGDGSLTPALKGSSERKGGDLAAKEALPEVPAGSGLSIHLVLSLSGFSKK